MRSLGKEEGKQKPQVSEGMCQSMDQALLSDAEQLNKRNREKLVLRKFPLNMSKNFFTVQWPRAEADAREGVEFCSMEVFQNHLDKILCPVLWDDFAGAGRWDQRTYCGPFQPETFGDSVIQLEYKPESTPTASMVLRVTFRCICLAGCIYLSSPNGCLHFTALPAGNALIILNIHFMLIHAKHQSLWLLLKHFGVCLSWSTWRVPWHLCKRLGRF